MISVADPDFFLRWGPKIFGPSDNKGGGGGPLVPRLNLSFVLNCTISEKKEGKESNPPPPPPGPPVPGDQNGSDQNVTG